MTLATREKLGRVYAVAFALMAVAVAVGCMVLSEPEAALAALAPAVVGLVVWARLTTLVKTAREAARVAREGVAASAKATFDAPADVRSGYDHEATNTGPLMMRMKTDDPETAFTAVGRFGDINVAIGSHVSILGRQNDESHHTYSQVIVDVLGLDKPFRLTHEFVTARLGKHLGTLQDIDLGDAEFDAAFLLASDDEFCRAVLDESIRKRLLSLQADAKKVSVQMGVGNLSVLLSKRGLALHWPGEMTPERAVEIRDLLVDMRANMLAHQNRAAMRLAAEAGAGGYRIAAEEARETAADEDGEAEARTRTIQE